MICSNLFFLGKLQRVFEVDRFTFDFVICSLDYLAKLFVRGILLLSKQEILTIIILLTLNKASSINKELFSLSEQHLLKKNNHKNTCLPKFLMLISSPFILIFRTYSFFVCLFMYVYILIFRGLCWEIG